jgi:hypothetical protein
MVRHAMSLEPRGFDCSVMDQFTGFYILHVPRPPHISDTGKGFHEVWSNANVTVQYEMLQMYTQCNSCSINGAM